MFGVEQQVLYRLDVLSYNHTFARYSILSLANQDIHIRKRILLFIEPEPEGDKIITWEVNYTVCIFLLTESKCLKINLLEQILKTFLKST